MSQVWFHLAKWFCSGKIQNHRLYWPSWIAGGIGRQKGKPSLMMSRVGGHIYERGPFKEHPN